MPTKNKKVTPHPDDAQYLEFLSKLQLVGLGLKSSSTSLERNVFYELSGEKEKPVRQFVEEYRPSYVGGDCFEAEGRYRVTVADGDSIGLQIDCVFEVHMHGTKPVPPDMVERFAKSDLRFILLPYARQFVTSVTGQMQIPPVVLPLAAASGKARPAKTKSRE